MKSLTLAPAISSPNARLWQEATAALLCAFVVAVFVGGLDPGIRLGAPDGRAANLYTLLLNTLPALTALGLLVALTRRLLLSSWLVVLAVAGLYAANAAKMVTLQTPLLPSDLRLLAEPAPALKLFVHYLHFDVAHALLLALGTAVTLSLCRERRLLVLGGGRRVALGAVALAIGLSLTVGSMPLRRVYQSAESAFQPWALADNVANTGLISSLLLYHWQLRGGAIPAADRAAAVALLKAHAPQVRAALAATTSPQDLPDIVVVQSESLFDPARLRTVPSGRYLDRYHELARSAVAGELRVPTYAGGTIRTEFEMLTGAPLESLGGVQYPWLELERDTYPGLTRVLDAHGYRSVAIHPNAATFWNRAKAYPALGFDRFVDAVAFLPEQTVGLFTSDAALTDRVVAELADEGPPQFVFAISIENHGPFDWRPGLDADRLRALPMPGELDPTARFWFGNYLYLLDDADRELGRLAGLLMQRQRRTVLMFYGDHLPDLGPVYAQLGFDDGREAKQQPVPWLLLDTEQTRPRRVDTASWVLPALLLDAAGIRDHGYFSIIAALAETGALDADDVDSAAGLTALARLQLRGELGPIVDEIVGPVDAEFAG